MKTKMFGRNSRRGSALLAAMIVIVILSVAAAGVLSYSLTTYRNSRRQVLLDQARVISDSEMENLYFQWKQLILHKTAIVSVKTTPPLGGTGGLLSTTNNFPFLRDPSTVGWAVTRELNWKQIPGTPDGSATGIMPGTVNQLGKIFYFEAKTSATFSSPIFGTITYHSGRHFQYTSTSLFQFAVFYEGNLELTPGSDMIIQGPIATNASAWLGTLNNASNITLTLASSVYYFENFNGASDNLSGLVNSLTPSLDGAGNPLPYNPPIFNPNPGSAEPTQPAERQLQVAKLANQANFVGDVNVLADVGPSSPYLAAYTNYQTGLVDANEIYRAVIAPPPLDPAPPHSPLAEDPVVAASRMYNAAGILISVDATSGTPVYHIGGVQSDGTVNPTAYDATLLTAVHSGAAADIITTVRQHIVDPREELNGKSGVNLTTIDIQNLTAALPAAMAANPGLAANYNGVVYVYDKTDTTVDHSLNGILIDHGTTTPAYNDSSGNPLGFTVVSDNGVYVHSDFNTTQITVNGVQQNNPASIMGDAVTAVSYGWDPANSNLSYNNRVAVQSPGSNPPGMTINAAILTGNTPTNTSVTPNIKSGGAQNLVRLMEDWSHAITTPAGGLTLTVNGSMGQLFSSKYFQGNYTGNGPIPALVGHPTAIAGGDTVYTQPHVRNFNYDLNFQSHPPAGSPVTTSFHKGDFFFW